MSSSRKYLAICRVCDGWVASHCADDPSEERDALAEAIKWEARGDVAVVVTFDPERVQRNPLPMCSCQRPRAHIVHDLRRVLTWVPVEQGLPDADATVLVAYEAGHAVAEGYFDGERWIDSTGWPITCATHWAELPDPPAF